MRHPDRWVPVRVLHPGEDLEPLPVTDPYASPGGMPLVYIEIVNQRPPSVFRVSRTSSEPPLAATSSLSCRSARSGPSVTAQTDGGRWRLRPPVRGGRLLDALRAGPCVRDSGGSAGPGGGERPCSRCRCRHGREPTA